MGTQKETNSDDAFRQKIMEAMQEKEPGIARLTALMKIAEDARSKRAFDIALEANKRAKEEIGSVNADLLARAIFRSLVEQASKILDDRDYVHAVEEYRKNHPYSQE